MDSDPITKLQAVQAIICQLRRMKAVLGLYLSRPLSILALIDYMDGVNFALSAIGIALERKHILTASSYRGWDGRDIMHIIGHMHDLGKTEEEMIGEIMDVYIMAWEEYLESDQKE